MPKRIERREGRHLFGLNPQAYDDSRPDYPHWIFEDLRDRGALVPDTPTLEIGAGTGRATRRLLEFGARPLTIVEPDERFATMLASATRESTADCQVIHQSFEAAALPIAHFDLVAAATSFHWIEAVSGLRKVKRLLTSEGVAALFWNVLQTLGKDDPFHDATQALLSDLAVSPSGSPDTVPYALDQPAREADAHAAGFDDVQYVESRWTLVLDTKQVGQLYEGFSHIQQLDAASRENVLARLMEIADTQFKGRVERNVTSCLYVLT
jgi:SAM-dependent methyltransferase